jgi:DNA repair photolyase
MGERQPGRNGFLAGTDSCATPLSRVRRRRAVGAQSQTRVGPPARRRGVRGTRMANKRRMSCYDWAMSRTPQPRRHGRGTLLNPSSRFDRLSIEPDDAAVDETAPQTEFLKDATKTLITRNDSPDIPFEFSINPYRGCEHGCAYCYARPYHEYLGLSAGLDFESKIVVKADAPDLLRRELARSSWRGAPLGLSGVTDCYQPVERRLELTRRCLELMVECRQPVGAITKSGLVARDAELYGELARHGAADVCLTITTLDERLRRSLEPRAATADVRLDAVARLAEHGVPVGVMVAPVIPGLTDHEIPRILRRAREAGATWAGFTLLRLPHGVGSLFDEWLNAHVPDQREKILGRLRQVRLGCLTDARFGVRMSGEGPLADVTAQLFTRSRGREGLAPSPPPLSSAAFRRPVRSCPLFE